MLVSLNYDTGTAWKLPFAPSELTDALAVMWLEFSGQYGQAGKEAEAPLDLQGMAKAGLYLELALVDELEMARLNGQFLNCFGPTNVLAFPAPEAEAWRIGRTAEKPGSAGFEAALSEGEHAFRAGPVVPAALRTDAGPFARPAACQDMSPDICSKAPLCTHPAAEQEACPEAYGAYLGWLAMSPDTVCREAMLYGQKLEAHTMRLLAHGFAHLLGYEHGKAMDAAANGAAAAVLAHFSES